MQRSLVFLLLFALSFSAGPACAGEPAHIAPFKKLQEVLKKIHVRLGEKREANDKALTDLGNEGMEAVGETASALKGHFEGILKSALGAKARAWEDFAFEPRSDELALLSVLLRADVIAGKPERVAALLDGLAANLHLSLAWLHSAHAVAVGAGRKRLPYGDYRTIRGQLERNLNLLKNLFPQVSRLPFGTVSREGKYEVDTARTAELTAFLSVPPKNELPAEAKKFLDGMINLVDSTVFGFDAYRRSYPQKHHEEVLNSLASELVNEPGALDCLQVARGLSDFTGGICQPPAFAKALDNYLTFFTQVGSGETLVLPTVEEFLTGLYETKGKDVTAEDITDLAKDLRVYVDKSNFHPRIKERWDKVEKRMFGDFAKLKALLGKGPALHAFLAEAVRAEGLVSPLGFDGDYFENVEAVKILKERFVKEKLDTKPNLERITVSMPCTPFLEGKDTPWTVNTLVAAALPPRAENSAEGFQRLLYAHEVMVGDSRTIQNSKIESRMVSGLGGHYALRLLVPNIVQLRLLLGKEIPENLEGLTGVVEKESPDSLLLARAHYKFPEFDYYIAETRKAFDRMVEAAWMASQDKAATPAEQKRSFLANYRQNLAVGAQSMREVIGFKEKLKAEAAKMASPAISEVLQIPVEFTGEYDKRFAAQVNDSLINVFLPEMMRDYIFRKHPETKLDRNAYAQKYNALKHTFTLDQFMDQLDWYWGMDLVRAAREGNDEFKFADVIAGKKRIDELPSKPLRRPLFMGVEDMKLLWAYPHFAARLLNHTMESFQRKLDYMEYAERQLAYRFPMLKWEENYKTYDDSRYELVLSAFLAHAENQVKDIWKRKQTDKLLDYVAPNLPLLDLVLRSHPDQKKGICQIQKDRGLWEKGTDIALTSTAVVASTIALVPPLAPIGLAIDGVILVVEGVRAHGRAQELASAEALWITGSAQLEQSVYDDGGEQMRELKDRYAESVVRVALQVAAMTPGVVANLPMIARLPVTLSRSVRAGWTATRAAHAEWRAAIALERAAAKAAIDAHPKTLWWSVAGGRLAKALSLTKATRDHLMFPFVRLGLAQKWTQRTLFQRLYPQLAWRRLHRLAWNSGGFVKDVVINLPFSLVGYGLGRGVLAKAWVAYGLYELTLWGVHSVRNAQEMGVALMLERIQSDPGTYGDLMQAMHEGEITHNEMMQIIELDDTLGQKYRESLGEWAKAFQESSTAEERKTALENFRTLETELGKELKALEAQANFDPQKARVWRRVLRDSKRLRLELSSAEVK